MIDSTHPRDLARRPRVAAQGAPARPGPALALALGALGLASLVALTACPQGQEAPRTSLAVIVDGGGLGPVTSDLGWQVTLTTCRAAIADLVFTTAGEVHDGSASLGDHLRRLVIADAWAHPGHAAGGEVIGELPGRFIVDWCAGDGAKLGDADLIVGDYNGANFDFIRAEAADGLADDDPLVGHTLELAGVATLAGASITFHAVLDQDAGRQVVGLPFDLDVAASSTERLGVQLLPRSPTSAETLFDGVDFAAADDDDDGVVELAPGDDAHNRLLRAAQSHDFYRVEPSP